MKLKFWIIILFNYCSFWSSGQTSFFQNADSINKGRIIGSSIGTAAVWSGSIIGLNYVWYKDYPQTKFHSFNDAAEWFQMDKVGHVYTAYHISDKVANLYKWAGLSTTKSALIGAGVGWGYQLSLELLDAKSVAWGFSWSDMAANTLGSSLFLVQELAWQEQRFKLKFSYSPTKYAQYRPNTLGSNCAESLLKDYNGQTYWLSFSPGLFIPATKIPTWLCLSVGYSVDAKLHGLSNTYQTLDGKTFNAAREFVLSLDIDVSKLPIQKKWAKTLLSPFSLIKIPFPAVYWRGSTFYGSWMYF